MARKSVEIRSDIVEALRLDLIGPDNNHAFARELLPPDSPPTRWYLTGFLVPSGAPAEQRTDQTSADQIDSGEDKGGLDDAAQPDKAATRSYLPSSMGLSVLVAKETKKIHVTVAWGDYIWESEGIGDEEPGEVETAPAEHAVGSVPSQTAEPAPENPSVKRGYRRNPREQRVTLDLPEAGAKPTQSIVPQSDGLELVVTVREIKMKGGNIGRIPQGSRAVSIFLVNKRRPLLEKVYRSFAFQASLQLEVDESFIPRPDLRCAGDNLSDDWDEQVADLQYRDAFEYAVGHGISAIWDDSGKETCDKVRSLWIPTAEVDRVEPSLISNVELRMEAIGELADAVEAKKKLLPLVSSYRNWIESQKANLDDIDQNRKRTSDSLLALARYAADRIEQGIEKLSNPEALRAFRIANSAMAKAARQRSAVLQNKRPEEVPAPSWRPFQLAFILMTIRGLHDPFSNDREMVDLLFFPTGGGKTEAYLGLAAFTLVLRRLRYPGIGSAGVSVLMRYTLRLLTLDQLSRAATVMCALELERKSNPDLGEWPFEIGLWVGSAATPNRMGRQGYTGPGKDETAYAKTRRFKQDSKRYPAPIPIENCPWCGAKFERDSFRLSPNQSNPNNLIIHCANYQCHFSGDVNLPIVAVDEPIYQRLPAFLIATVDKFASLPWTAETGALFGFVDRYDEKGFYGPASPGLGKALGGNLPPPDLIIQDELHLISGPLGTIAGIYETTIDALSTRVVDGKKYRPKIIASTATVRRADSQIRALFDRQQVAVFPSPGPDRRNSFFAHQVPPEETPARLYVGIAAQGRSLKVVMLRAMMAILSSSQTSYNSEGGKRNKSNPTDPYMTLLGYFNSLRELGGSRRIVEDEVRSRLTFYSRRKRKEPEDTLFVNREIQHEVLELTSRVPTNDIARAKRRLSLPFYEEERVDVALATNMISVGLDITRLGLMIVLGQPKTSAEYIQATSRVGRDADRPGLIVTLLNIHKPRDRSHYEHFASFHKTFYRSVEPTSVTPFSPRALDRALVGALVALVRQGEMEMTPALGATEILRHRPDLDKFCESFARRAYDHDTRLDPAQKKALEDNVRARCRSLLDAWLRVADQMRQSNTNLKYQRWEQTPAAANLLFDMLDPELENQHPLRRLFRANRSMRDVEHSVDITIKNLNDY